MNFKHIVVFKVKGIGEFPFDMLRYDRCSPSTQEDVPRMVDYNHMREIELVKYTDLKTNPRVTTARWNSFGWAVTSVKYLL